MSKIVIRPGNSNNPSPKPSGNKNVSGKPATPRHKQQRVKHGYANFPKKKALLIIASLVFVLSLFFLLPLFTKPPVPPPPPPPPAPAPLTLDQVLGFDRKDYQQKEQTPAFNLALMEWLTRVDISEEFQSDLLEEAKSLGIDTLYQDKLLKTYQDSSGQVVYAVYQKEDFKFALFRFAPYPLVKLVELPVEIREATATGILRDSQLLFMRLVEDVNSAIAIQAEEALKYSIDFYHLEDGDEFKLIYQKKMVFGKLVKTGLLKAISVKTDGKTVYAIYCDTHLGPRYLNDRAKTVEKNFLLAPVKNVRISSRYDPFRLHPVLNIVKAHKGTDYAAPLGTEIFSVADGTVIEASNSRYNGNYIKIRHENPYMTQYLHMQHYAAGMTPGKPVKMGQVIGYVGATGENITGAHVCFRFWKNGEQVDHLKEPFKAPTILSWKEEDEFRVYCEKQKQRLDELTVQSTGIL